MAFRRQSEYILDTS